MEGGMAVGQDRVNWCQASFYYISVRETEAELHSAIGEVNGGGHTTMEAVPTVHSYQKGGLPPTFLAGFHNEVSVRQMKYNPLGRTGLLVSQLSLGGSSLGGVFREVDEKEGFQVVQEAIKAGVNLIDTSPWYGHGKAESRLGKILSTIPRSSYYLSTKVGRYQPERDKMFDFSAERTIQSVEESLCRLNVDYVDIIQVHDMEFAPSLDIILTKTLPALQKIKERGKARYIGITGYPLDNFQYIIERSLTPIDTVLSYCHATLHDNSLADYIPFFKEKGIGIINASPMSMGLLTDQGPPIWHPAGIQLRKACEEAAEYCRLQGVNISKLALHFTLSQPDIVTTLVSTDRVEYLKTNLTTVNSQLTPLEQETLEYIRNTYMRPLEKRSWEGVEVKRHREALSNI